MKLFQRILVYCRPEGEPALRRAAAVGRATGGAIKLIDVIERPPAWMRALTPRKSHLPELIKEERKERLEELAGPLRKQGLRVETKVLSGKVPSLEITREAVKQGYDLVIKNAAAEARASFLETTDVQLLRQCPCPVWLVKPRRAGRRSAIVAAIAPSPDESASNIPNAEIMDMAIHLSQLLGCELHVVRAWRAYGEGALRRKAKIKEPDLRDYLAATRQKLGAALKGLLAHYGDHIKPKRVHLLKGHPGSVIPSFAKTRPIDIVVMGGGPRKGVADILIGSTTERIISNVDYSVFAVKPKDFVSAIKRDDVG